MNSWLPFFEWCEGTRVATIVRDSLWLFPVIEAVHLVTFAFIGGAILLVDLRLLGLGLRGQTPGRVQQEAQPWLIGSLAVMILSGTLLFLSEAVKCYYSQPFLVKMTALSLAITYTFTVRRLVAAADEKNVGPVWGKLAAAVSLGLWGSVAWGGRWIGFSG